MKRKKSPHMTGHAFNLRAMELEAEFQASLVYIRSSGLAWSITVRPCLEKGRKRKQEKKKKKLKIQRNGHLEIFCVFCHNWNLIFFYPNQNSRDRNCTIWSKEYPGSGTGEMAQQVQALAALPEDHIQLLAPAWWLAPLWNSSSGGSSALFWPLWVLHTNG